MKGNRICAKEDCALKHYAKDKCHNHYMVDYMRGRPRYKNESRKGHPIASKNGVVAVHRLVVWYKYDGEDTICYHGCGTALYWFTEDRRSKVYVDHLDGNVLNNDEGNVVASCQRCNCRNNGKPKKTDELALAA